MAPSTATQHDASLAAAAAKQASKGAPVAAPRQIVHSSDSARMASQDDPLIDEDGDDVFSNPDTAELESRSDATGATSPTPNSPGPGSPSNRLSASHHITVVAPSGLDQFATVKQHDFNPQAVASQDVNASSTTITSPSTKVPGTQGARSLALGSLPQTNLATLQQQYDMRASVDSTPRPTSTSPLPSVGTASITPTKASSPRPIFGRALSASGATLQTLGSSTHGSARFDPSTPRLGGHASSQSASHFSVPYSQLPSAHGLPSNPREASTLSKLFAHPPAQSPAEELQGFHFGGDGFNPRRASVAMGPSPSASGFHSSGGSHAHATPAASALASRHLSRPSNRPSSPERYMSPSRKSTKRASMGVTGLGLSPRMGASMADDSTMMGTSSVAVESESSIFERDIEHRDASHVLSKQEAMDVAIPSVLTDAVEAIQSDTADQLEIIAPHAALPPLALSMQALSVHSNSQSKLNQSSDSAVAHSPPSSAPQVPVGSATYRSNTSSPYMSPSPPLSNAAGGIDAPPGSMAAQIAERLAAQSKVTNAAANAAHAVSSSDAENNASSQSAAQTSSRHRRPHSDVSNMSSSSSSMRSRSPQTQLAAGVQQVMATGSTTSPRSPTGVHSPLGPAHRPAEIATSNIGSTTAATPSSNTIRSTLPTATALPALPLPNPFRAHSPTTSLTPLPDLSASSMLPSVSMDGAVIPSHESAKLDASLVSIADVIASQPPTSTNSLANSPSMRMRGLGFDDLSYEASPYSSRSPVVGSGTHLDGSSGYKAASQPASPTSERNIGAVQAKGLASSSRNMDRSRDENAVSLTSSSKKRLSFFSYADIINDTPAEVLKFDEAVRQVESATVKHSTSPVSATPTVGRNTTISAAPPTNNEAK